MVGTLELWDGADWVEIPMMSFSVKNTDRNPVTELDCDITSSKLTETQLGLLTFNRRIKFTHVVGSEDFSFEGNIIGLPRRLTGPLKQIISLTCYDESYRAGNYRFLDFYPKPGIATWSEIVEDVWTNYGPAGITFTGLDNNTETPESIASFWGTLYEFMEAVAKSTGWRWKVVQGDLKFFDPELNIAAETITGTDVRPDSTIDGGQPEIGNIVYVPAQFQYTDFNDEQKAITGQAQYFLQYVPLTKPVIVVNSVPVDPSHIALDGSFEAAAAWIIYNPAQKIIRFNAGYLPSGGDLLSVTYDAFVPVIVERRDEASITLYSEFQHILKLNPRPVREEAEKAGDAYLALHSFPVTTLSAEMLLQTVRCGWYYSVQFEDIDQLMPCVSVERNSQNGQYTVNATFTCIAINDTELMFDVIRRLEQLEKPEGDMDERMERTLHLSDSWLWSDEIAVIGWSDVEWLSDNGQELKHNALYVMEQSGARKVYPS